MNFDLMHEFSRVFLFRLMKPCVASRAVSTFEIPACLNSHYASGERKVGINEFVPFKAATSRAAVDPDNSSMRRERPIKEESCDELKVNVVCDSFPSSPAPLSQRERGKEWSRFREAVFGLTIFFVAIFAATNLQADNDPASRIDRTKLKNSLDQQFSPAWDRIGLRDIVRSLQEVLGVSVILDRRIDPTIERSLKVSSNTLKECCERLAAECDAGTTVLGSALYFGPKSTAAKLRTLAALRKQELLAMSIPLSRKNRLLIGNSIRWNDLDQPVDLLKQIGESFNLKIEKLELVPHDAWAGDAVRDVTAIEALTLVLAQFDLTFTWTSEAAGVRVMPMPQVVVIERQYDPPNGASPEIAATRWKEEVNEIETRVAQGKVVVKGTEEQHEIVERLRQGKGKTPQPVKPVGKLPPLAQKRYTANIANISVSDLMHTLEQPEQGQLTFEFDEADLVNAGIDFKRPATFELKNAKIDEMLRKMFGPLGVKYELKERTVYLTPGATK